MPRALLVAAALSFSAFAPGCGGGPTFDGHHYRDRTAGVAFAVADAPASWSRLGLSSGLLAFRDHAASATVLVNGRCGKDGEDVPLAALTAHLFFQFTEREAEEEDTVAMDGREALRTVLRAKLDGVPKRFEAVVMKKDGCVYDFVLIADPASFPQARPAFEAYVAGFRTEAR